MGIALADHFHVLYRYTLRANQGGRGKSHGHAMVFVGSYLGIRLGLATLSVPCQDAGRAVVQDVTQLAAFLLQCFDAVGLFDSQTLQTPEVERHVQKDAGNHEGLRQVRLIHEVIRELLRAVPLVKERDTLREITSPDTQQ